MTVNFEIGSVWKTRGGWRAVVVDVYKDKLDVCRDKLDAFHHCHNGAKHVVTHYVDGSIKALDTDDYDLIEPWVDLSLNKVKEETK